MIRTRSARVCTAALVVLCVVVLGPSDAGAATVRSVALRLATLDRASTSAGSLARYEHAVQALHQNCSAPNVGAIGDAAVRARKALGRGGLAPRVQLLTILQDVNRFIGENYTAHGTLSCVSVFNGYVALNS